MEIVLTISIAVTVIAIVFALSDVIPKCIEEHHEYLSKLAKEDNEVKIEAIKLEEERERTKQAIEKTNVANMENEKWQKQWDERHKERN